jgi:hypothetical protein
MPHHVPPPPHPRALMLLQGVLWSSTLFPTKTALQVEIDRAAKLPGPGEYNVRPRLSSRGAVIPESKGQTYIDLVAKRAADMPVSAGGPAPAQMYAAASLSSGSPSVMNKNLGSLVPRPPTASGARLSRCRALWCDVCVVWYGVVSCDVQAPGESQRERVPPSPTRLKSLHQHMASLAKRLGEGAPPKPPVLNGKLMVKLSPR